jgi:formate C-acetyltransferase
MPLTCTSLSHHAWWRTASGRGNRFRKGGAIYNFTGTQGVGVANAGDSLTAVKKLVFEDKALTMEQ